jgi:hypothetical protein
MPYFKNGAKVKIVSGRFAGMTGEVTGHVLGEDIAHRVQFDAPVLEDPADLELSIARSSSLDVMMAALTRLKAVTGPYCVVPSDHLEAAP